MKDIPVEIKTSDENTSRSRKHVLLHILPPFLTLLFCVGVYLAVEPLTRHWFIVIYVPIYSFVCILYVFIFLSSDHDSPSPTVDEDVDDVPTVTCSIEVDEEVDKGVDKGVDKEVDSATKQISKDSDKFVTNELITNNNDAAPLSSTVTDALYRKVAQFKNSFFSVGATVRDAVYQPCLPPSTKTEGSITNETTVDVIQSASTEDFIINVTTVDVIQSASTQKKLTIPDGLHPDSERCNLSGTFKLATSSNLDSFLKAMNVSWSIRKAAGLAKPIHTYTHVEDAFRVQIDGFVKGDTTYIINGPTVKSAIRHKKFVDSASYLDSGDGIMVRKISQNPAPGDATELIVRRRLTSDKTQILLLSKAIYSDGSESLEAEQIFQRVTAKK